MWPRSYIGRYSKVEFKPIGFQNGTMLPHIIN